MSSAKSWSIVNLWNESFAAKPRRSMEPRDYIYASELGKSYHEVYHKMIGTPESNQPTFRSLRKFEMGNLVEWTLRFVLMRAGVLQRTQIRVKTQEPGCVPVSGRMDFLAGGKMDFTRAEKEIADLELPDFFAFTSRKIIEHMKANFSSFTLQQYIIECKSVSEFVFARNERAGCANPDHILQLYHYLHGYRKENGKPLEKGKIMYICKDDARVQEFDVKDTAQPRADYMAYVEKITDYYRSGEVPPLEKPVTFHKEACSFQKNWKIEYSPYLTLSYGYETADEFFEKWAPLVASMNRVYKRCVNGDKMTDKNIEVIREAKKIFPDFDELVDLGKAKGVMEEEDGDS